ncbi:unnamed protein product [Blepharisma stoltei]|uniref:RING-type domain-containing protein n=1 Tax=Blepharisma stoltei TaxID=1481888 RepID=A0AAU9IH65_9CILI|nr:unnamed protein product [Blepharisma stoltei]
MTDDMGQALTISALVLVSLFCMGCCLVLFRKMYKSAQRQRLVYDQYFVSYMRARNYAVLPENSVIIEDELERWFPRAPFNRQMVQVSESTCCICFEDFADDASVRKLTCKHLFHVKCIDDWFQRREAPICPLCKVNPFLPVEQPPIPQVNEHLEAQRGETEQGDHAAILSGRDLEDEVSFTLP